MSKNREFRSDLNYTGADSVDMAEEHFSHKKDRANKRWEKIKRKKSRWDDSDEYED